MNKIALVLVSLAAATPLLAKAEAVGRVATLAGEARTQSAALAVGDQVHVGDKISTGKSTTLRLLLDDDIAIQVGPESSFEVTRPAPRKTSISLLGGMVLSRVRDLVKSRKQYEVRTRDAVMGVRGTTFFVKKTKTEPSFICACNGKVAINGEVFTSKAHENVFHASGLKAPLKRAADMGKDHNDDDYEALGKVLDQQTKDNK